MAHARQTRVARRLLSLLMLPSLGLSAAAFAGGTVTLVYGPAGNPSTETKAFSGVYADQRSFSGSAGGNAWATELWVLGSPRLTAAHAFVSGTFAATAQVTVKNALATYTLTPPAGANIASGKLVIYTAVGPGDIRGNGAIDLTLDVRAYRGITWEATGGDHRTVTDQAGSEQVEFPVVVALPATLDSTLTASVEMTMTLKASADIAPPAGSARTSIADAYGSESAGRITGFRVLDAAGAQVPGFTLRAGALAVEERMPAPAGIALAVEFYNPAFAHFFVTAGTDEIAKLDAGVIAGWQRTGESFNVYTAPGAGRAGVCRFFSASFAPKSSHFYAPHGLGCEEARANATWQYEGDVFYMPLPDASGNCPAGTTPVYRLYNNGQGGAPNHRFTTSDTTFAEMKRDGYIAEGAGVGIGMCSPQ